MRLDLNFKSSSFYFESTIMTYLIVGYDSTVVMDMSVSVRSG